MAPGDRAPPPEDDEDAVDPEDEEPSKSKSGGTGHRRRSRTSKRPGVKAWDAAHTDRTEDPAPSAAAATDDDADEGREHVYFRARDSVWFEPLVAVMIIAVLLVGLYAYTDNWPPVYVVESESMQHGYSDQLGLINTGDLVLARQVPTSSIVPYVVGMQTGYSTYGEYGDVTLYHQNGDPNGAPIIHRAILFLQYNSNGSYSAPELHGLPCGDRGAIFFSANSTNARGGCSTIGIRGTLTLFGVGWQGVTVQLALDPSVIGRWSGFVTMGDNNIQNGQGIPDQDDATISQLVQPGWVIGVARGMIPWFGALKLALDGNDTEVPAQSWQYMGLTLVGLFLGALGLHLFLRAEGIEDERRKKLEAEAIAGGEARPPRRRSRWRIWERDHGDEEPEDAPPKTKRRPPAKPLSGDPGGRPRPRIGRSPTKSDEGDDPSSSDPDDEL